jgi:gliding motility-associated-like protein
MKKCHCFSKNFSNLIFLLFVLLSLQSSLFAQHKAATGMRSEEANFSSFSNRPIQSLDSWKRINQQAYFSHPEFGVLPSDAPCTDCIEDLSKRTEDGRYFVDKTDQQQYYQQKAMGQLHELIDGQWLTIDHRLKNSSNGIYKSGFNIDRAGFNVYENHGFLETNLGKLRFNQWKLIVKKEGQLQSPVDANWSTVSVGDDGIKIYSIFPGIDAEMRVLRGAIKTNFIIKTNEFGIFDELIFTDEFDAAGGVNLAFTDGQTQEGVGDVFVKNDQGELAFIQKGILYAKNGPKDLFLEPVYKISGSNLGVIVPFNWINDNIDEYELVVDPLVTGTNTLAQAAIAGSQYNASCNFTNFCPATLTVPRPANATITDVTWSFNYNATGICWLEDGGVRFSAGSCLSPAAAGFYWFCNLTGNGTCTGTNVSIFNDLGSCIPAPSCVPVNVTFTMQFFRGCWGTSGCNNTCIGAGSPWTMTISGRTLEYTNAASNMTVSATTVCQGGTITASTAATYGVPAYTYNWSFSPTGLPSIGAGANATITFPTSGIVTLFSLVTDACGNLITTSRVITVNPSPAITATPNAQIICSGQSTGIALSSSVVNTTYTWTVVQNGVSGASNGNQTGNAVSINQTLTATGSIAGTATYTITPSASGCSGTPITVIVTVNPNLTASVSATASATTICDGTPITFTASPTNGGTAPSYQWFVDGNPVAGQTNSTFTSTTLASGASVTVQMTSNATPCLSVPTATSLPIVVTINPSITASVSISESTNTICTGGSVTFTATPTNGGTAPSYQWFVDGNPVAGETNSIFTSTSLANGASVTVQMTSNPAPCLIGSPATSNAVSITVNPVLIPSVAVTANTTSACTGAAVIFTATPTNGGTTPSYQWYVDGNPVAGQTNSTFTSTSLTSGASVTVQMTSNATPCLSVPTATSSAIVVTINPLITASVTISASTNTICAGSSVTFTATPTNGGTAPSYQWFINGNPVAGQTSSTFTSTTIPNGASVTVQMTSNATPCLVGSPATSNAEAIVVNPSPVVTVTNNGPLCVTQQLDLSATTIAGATYSWTGPQSFTSLSQNPSIPNVTLANAGNYIVTVSLNGCTTSVTSLVAIVTGFPATINPSGPFCSNAGIVTLIASAGGGTWSGQGITNASSGSFNPSLATVGINTISYTTPGTCGGTSTIDIVILPIPSISISSNITSGCSPLAVTFTDNSTPTSTAVLWNFGNGETSATSGSTSYTNSGCYDVTLTSTNAGGCTASQTFNDIVCVLEDPIADFSTNEYATSIYDPTFQFINQSEFANSYLWQFENGIVSTLVNPLITYPGEPGSYAVQLVAYNAAGCSDTITKIVTVLDELVFYVPNSFTPNGDEFNNSFVPVFTSGFDPFEFNLTIFNRWGEIIFESKDAEEGWDGTYNNKIVPDGIYTWTIRLKDNENDKKYTYTGHVNVLK